MLTDLSFLERGQKWPPPSESARLKTYEENRRLFEGEHSEVYREQMRRIERVVGNFSSVVSFPVIFNYQRLMSLKIADLIFGESPSITVADTSAAGSAKQQTINKILLDTELLNLAYTAAIDVSRYGDGLLIPSLRDGKPKLTISAPRIWFPVVDKTDIQCITYHVMAHHYTQGKGTSPEHFLWVQIHNVDAPGTCEEHTYRLRGGSDSFTIGEEIAAQGGITDADTGFVECPVFRVSNVRTSDRIFGFDDYSTIDSIISELIVRVSQVCRILDKHAAPSMSGPASALERDPITDEWRLRTGDYFTRENSDDPETKYIVWDAQLDANFKAIETLVNHLYAISEMGAALLGGTANNTGQVPSGSALRRLMVQPLAKSARIAGRFDPAIKKILSLLASALNVDIPPEEISITWNDGLPDDPMEEATIMSIRTGARPTISQWSAMKRLDRLSDEDADSELEQLQAEQSATAPITLGVIDNHDAEGEDDA